MQTENLEAFSDVTMLLRGLANRLDFLSGAFEATGNQKVADELLLGARDAMLSAASIEKQVSEIAYEAFQDSQQATLNMMNGILAAVAMTAANGPCDD